MNVFLHELRWKSQALVFQLLHNIELPKERAIMGYSEKVMFVVHREELVKILVNLPWDRYLIFPLMVLVQSQDCVNHFC